MDNVLSSAEDCYNLSSYLKDELKNKIRFNTPMWLEILAGEYFFDDGRYRGFFRKGIYFYIKYNKDEFLRLQVCSSFKKESTGQKLVVLSELYKVISKKVGEPIVFYTTKDDDEGTLSLEWVFKNKESVIESFRSGTHFDDAEIDKLIILRRTNSKLKEETRRHLSNTIGLPYELIEIIDENIEEYLKYKNLINLGNVEDRGLSKKLTLN